MYKTTYQLFLGLILLLSSCGDGIGEPISNTPTSPTVSNHFIITSIFDDNGALNNAGSVMLVDGTTGVQIGSTLFGDAANDRLGRSGVISLGNGNFVIASSIDDNGALNDAGSVMLINGTTAVQVGSTLFGDATSDFLGGSSITSLGNGNFVIASHNDDNGALTDAGSVMLVDGTTGVQIGSTLFGDAAFDQLGISSVTSLGNGNFVIASESDNNGAISNTGSVMLIDGMTGVQIGSTIFGDAANDQLGNSSVTSLGNGNFVIASAFDDNGAFTNAGSVMLIDGMTGVQIGSTLFGDADNDELGRSSVTSLGNGNFVIATRRDDNGALTEAGSVMLIDGTTGVQIGSTLFGDAANDELGGSSVTSLGNGNFVIASSLDDNGAFTNAGSVMLIDGMTGVQIGSTIFGDADNDGLGGSSVTSLGNGNFVIASRLDDNGAFTNAGSVMLIDGTTGVQIASTVFGDADNDELGGSSVTSLGNGNFVIASSLDDNGALNNTGSIILIDGTTGVQIGSTLFGDAANDQLGGSSVTSLGNGNFVIASENDDNGALGDAGSVMLIDGTTGAQIGSTLFGDAAFDLLGNSGVIKL